MTIELRSIVVRTPGLLSTPVNDEIVILNPEHDNYVGLDAVGRAIWELIERPGAVGDICKRLSRDFDATPEQIAADLIPFLAEITDEGIARVVEP